MEMGKVNFKGSIISPSSLANILILINSFPYIFEEAPLTINVLCEKFSKLLNFSLLKSKNSY